MERIGEECFLYSGVEDVTLPNTLKEVSEDAFEGCRRLITVWVVEGCALDIGKCVGSNVEVHPK